MKITHIEFTNVYVALQEVAKILKSGGFAYVLKSDSNSATVSIFN